MGSGVQGSGVQGLGFGALDLELVRCGVQRPGSGGRNPEVEPAPRPLPLVPTRAGSIEIPAPGHLPLAPRPSPLSGLGVCGRGQEGRAQVGLCHDKGESAGAPFHYSHILSAGAPFTRTLNPEGLGHRLYMHVYIDRMFRVEVQGRGRAMGKQRG